MKIKTTLFYLLFLIIFNSCSLLLGFKKYKRLSEKEVIKTGKRLKIPNSQSFLIKHSLYRNDFIYLQTDEPKMFNDIFQPLQVKVYHKNKIDTTEVFLINCNLGGLFRLKWNRLGTFDEFPIKQKLFAKPETSFSLKDELKYIKMLQSKIPRFEDIVEHDMNIFVYWSRYTYKYSKQLIKLIKKYEKQFVNQKIGVFYVNIDNLIY